MDDGDGGLSFDFEGGLESGPTHPTASVPIPQSNQPPSFDQTNNNNNNNYGVIVPQSQQQQPSDGGTGAGRRSFRQTVCRHWLRSLCMKGDACGFLHQYDKSRMPVCRFFRLYGECREQDCVYKHTNEDIKECNMYKLGFCPNGPDCRYRHAKLPGPPPPVEEVLQKIQQLASFNYGNSNRFFQNRNSNPAQQTDKPQGPNGTPNVPKTATTEPLQQAQQGLQSQQLGTQVQIPNPQNDQQNQPSRNATPLPQGTTRYFVVKSCNRENLELSVQQGVWATQRSNEAKLNEAFESVNNVILIFSVNKTRNFQGCAKMTSRIGGSVGGGNWKHTNGTAHYGRNFDLKWLKLCELSFQKTRHLRNPYNENLPVKISRDCQELEPSVGEQLALLHYLEPDSDLMTVAIASEVKREEEKAKGINLENGNDNPDIVPFEDNEEDDDEEEESEEDDENFGPQGRGRGRGMMWPPHMPLAHGGRPFPGMRAFPPNMMGVDGFPYGPMNPNGFPMPDPFAMDPRGFGPYGPRFPGEFAGPMFPNRPPGGFGMMMGPGPGRAPFMGGMGPPGGRGGRPVGGSGSPFYPPMPSQASQNPNRVKKDQKGPHDRNDSVSDQARSQQTAGGPGSDGAYQKRGRGQHEDYYGGGNSHRNDESESEDEAPRRSRYGEGKKKRRSSEADSAGGSGEPV